MNKFYEKLAIICGDIVLFGSGVKSISKPVVIKDNVHIEVRDRNGNNLLMAISVNDICKAHDYMLDNLIVKVLRDNNLLDV